MTDREQAIINAIGSTVRGMLAPKDQSTKHVLSEPMRFQMPPPIIRNEIQPAEVNVANQIDVPETSVTVQVDMQPVADAINRMTETIMTLVQALSERPAIEVNPTINVDAKPDLTELPAPIMNVNAPKPMRSRTTVKRDEKDDLKETVTEFEYD